MAAVSVVVATSDPGDDLLPLVRSIDGQSLPATEFDVVVADASTDGSAARLEQWAGRRRNVTVLTVDPGLSESDRLRVALERATGEYVLVASQRHQLAPRAVELMLGRARLGADLVLGRAVTATDSGCTTMADGDQVDLAQVRADRCVLLMRRSLIVASTGEEAAPFDLRTVVGEAATVSVVGVYACAKQGSTPLAPVEGVTISASTTGWEAGRLRLSAEVRLPEPTPAQPDAWVIVSRGLTEIALPAACSPTGSTGSAWIASADLDPTVAEAGHPVSDGSWRLLLRLAWPGREVTLPLPAGPKRPALIDGRPYVVHSAGGGQRVGAGAQHAGVTGTVSVTGTSITESVLGTLVTLEYPDLHVRGNGALEARLLLDRFALPARLVCEGGRGRLEAYVGTLAGTYALSVAVGAGKPVSTGLQLRVDGVGGTTFERIPAPQPQPPAAAPSGRAPLVQRVRRRLPSALDPVAHRLAEVPVLRRTYRRLLSR